MTKTNRNGGGTMPSRGEGRLLRMRKRKADGTVYVSPCWHISYWGPKKSGRWGEIREATHTSDENKARTILRGRLRAVANHRSGVATFEGPQQRKIRVSDLLDSLLTYYRNREIKSMREVLVHMNPMREFFGPLRAVDVTSDSVERYIEERKSLKPPRANATINREVELLSAAFGLAVKKARLSRKPYIPNLPENNARAGFFERDEIEKLLPLLPDPVDDMTRFAYMSGWRLGEVRVLRWEWVDRRAREVRLPDSKNGEGRALPLDEVDWQLIEKRWRMREYRRPDGGSGISEFLFHKHGRAVPVETIGNQWRKARTKANLPSKLFHDLRRTAVRDMVRAGVPQSVAMSISGHKTTAMFTRYNITSREDKIDALRKRRAYVTANPGTGSVVNYSATREDREK